MEIGRALNMPADTFEKAPDAYRTISEVAEDLDIPQHVLRFWETRFSQIRPLKRGGGRRYYRPDDVALIKGIRALLYGQGYTIKGVQRILKDQGVKQVQALARAPASSPGPGAPPPAVAAEAARAIHEDLQDDEVEEDVAGEDSIDGADEPSVVHIAALNRESRAKLESALKELSDCRRMIAAARGEG
ncbi:MerR family transcriptional regulator [Terrarubrum flagellatum]|uniref:MerR family transcriptional regulator n=1 Tax=Terrirubrum flagellatum TaxID=2895980 RepID=UPI003144F1E9